MEGDCLSVWGGGGGEIRRWDVCVRQRVAAKCSLNMQASTTDNEQQTQEASLGGGCVGGVRGAVCVCGGGGWGWEVGCMHVCVCLGEGGGGRGLRGRGMCVLVVGAHGVQGCVVMCGMWGVGGLMCEGMSACSCSRHCLCIVVTVKDSLLVIGSHSRLRSCLHCTCCTSWPIPDMYTPHSIVTMPHGVIHILSFSLSHSKVHAKTN